MEGFFMSKRKSSTSATASSEVTMNLVEYVGDLSKLNGGVKAVSKVPLALRVARDSRHLDQRLQRQHKFRARVAHVADLVIDRPILRNIALPAAADAPATENFGLEGLLTLEPVPFGAKVVDIREHPGQQGFGRQCVYRQKQYAARLFRP
jgi:hypothetical protein